MPSLQIARSFRRFTFATFVTFTTSIAALLFVSAASPCRAVQPCRIDIVEQGSGWPVPLVELRTTHNVRFFSDNAGVIAFDLPELMGKECWFFVEGNGYEFPKDGFGFRGVRLTPTPGGHLTVEVQRKLPAKRLGRITGAGIFGESQKLGLEKDWHEQGILGCDSVQNAVHNGKMYWAWGDTNLPGYPLGLFDMIGATTDVQPLDSFEPPVRLRYSYFTNEKNVPRVICKMPGSGPTWTSGFASLPDQTGRERLVGVYNKIEPPLSVYEQGLCVWDESEKRFRKLRVLWTKADGQSSSPPPSPEGHSVRWTDDDGKQWILFGDPFPRLRCPATFEDWSNLESWELLTPQKSVRSVDGDEIKPHRGSIAYSAYRNRWVAIFTQYFGDASALGEIWYAESDSPTGPWGPAVQVVTHDNYTFYNPRLHSEFTPDDSPILLFEGTYTSTFAKNPPVTPRHDYNQILYRLDLDDPRLIGRLK